MSEANKQTNTLAAAYVAAQGEFRPVVKDRENPYFKSEYATMKAVTEMVREVLARHGLAFFQSIECAEGSVKFGTVKTVLIHEGGEVMTFNCPYSCTDEKPQGCGSAITYFRRYALQCALGIAVCDATEDDANLANGNGVTANHQPSKTAAKPSQTAPKVAPLATPIDVCPLGKKSKGVKWSDMSEENIKAVLELPPDKYPQLTSAHRNAAKAELSRRADGGEKTTVDNIKI